MALRWSLGIAAALVAAGWAVLAVVGSGFRSSFGGSGNSPLLVLAPVVVALLVLASVVWPDRRVLLHIVAALMVALCIACAFLARETVFLAALGAAFAIAWLSFYYRV